MNTPTIWPLVSGFDTNGNTIRGDLESMIAGELDEDRITELLADLVRDGAVSTAAIPALYYLTGDLGNLPPDSRISCRYAACLILGIATDSDVVSIVGGEAELSLLRRKALKQLLIEASDRDLTEDWMLSIAAVLLLFKNDTMSYRKLMTIERIN